MCGPYIFNSPKIESALATVIHRVDIFNAFRLKPCYNFEIRYKGGICSQPNCQRIGNMVLVTMGKKNIISRNFSDIDSLCHLIVADKRVKQKVLFSNVNRKGGM